MLTAADARALEECIARGGVAVFPADTVYGIACDPADPRAVARLYELKRRPPRRPAAVMWFTIATVTAALPELSRAERGAIAALLPGPVTLLLPNRGRRFAPACADDPDTLGVRVPSMEGALSALGEVRCAVMQSSANLSGEPAARRLSDVDAAIVAGADLALDGGELPGLASTVLDLREWADAHRWHVLREGALPRDAAAVALGCEAAPRRPTA